MPDKLAHHPAVQLLVGELAMTHEVVDVLGVLDLEIVVLQLVFGDGQRGSPRRRSA